MYSFKCACTYMNVFKHIHETGGKVKKIKLLKLLFNLKKC